ncbi:MAG: class I SAM-dependent RNA methyltransferase [Leptospiraceae bacterium]|nr:class I SAM-dependent RNA methyltransferase [Leptospiraceae bacterium]
MKVFPEKRVRIEKLRPDLRGEGVFEEKFYSFPYTQLGDEVLFEERGRGNRRHLVVKDILRREAIHAKCSHYTQCGGCTGQHIPYKEQFLLKTGSLADRVKNEFRVTPVLVEATQQFYYRNRMDFAVFPEKLIGLHQAGNFRKVVDIEYCHIQNEEANRDFFAFRRTLDEFPGIVFHRKTEEGFLKYATYRRGIFTDDSLFILTFVKGFENAPEIRRLEERILQNLKSKNIVFCFNRKKAEVSATGEFLAIRGNPHYEEKLFGKIFKIPFDSFFQPNPKGFLPILEFIRDRLSEKNDTLVDLFCGSGFFSRLFGENFSEILGFDFVASSIEEANQTLGMEFPEKKIKFSQYNLFGAEDDLFREIRIQGKNVLILDPPRSGAGEKLSRLIRDSSFQEIFYVSCNPKSQLEDLKIISESFHLAEFLFTDPYPQTPHIETVAYLKRMK